MDWSFSDDEDVTDSPKKLSGWLAAGAASGSGASKAPGKRAAALSSDPFGGGAASPSLLDSSATSESETPYPKERAPRSDGKGKARVGSSLSSLSLVSSPSLGASQCLGGSHERKPSPHLNTSYQDILDIDVDAIGPSKSTVKRSHAQISKAKHEKESDDILSVDIDSIGGTRRRRPNVQLPPRDLLGTATSPKTRPSVSIWDKYKNPPPRSTAVEASSTAPKDKVRKMSAVEWASEDEDGAKTNETKISERLKPKPKRHRLEGDAPWYNRYADKAAINPSPGKTESKQSSKGSERAAKRPRKVEEGAEKESSRRNSRGGWKERGTGANVWVPPSIRGTAADPTLQSNASGKSEFSDGDFSDDFENESAIPSDGMHWGEQEDEQSKPRLPATAIKGPSEPLSLLDAKGNPTGLQVPATINQYLRDYQKEGVLFMGKRLAEDQGTLLADDMGLGKTVQVTALLAAHFGLTGGPEDRSRQWSRRHGQAGTNDSSVLIVCPASLSRNWLDEITRWTYLNVRVVERGNDIEELARQARNGQIDVVIVSYTLAQRNIAKFGGFRALPGKDDELEDDDDVEEEKFDVADDDDDWTMSSAGLSTETTGSAPWSILICDEVHQLKSKSSKARQMLSLFNSDRRIGLSGTVLQNKWEEYYRVLDFVVPDCLGSWSEFSQGFVKAITVGSQPDAIDQDLALKSKRQKQLQDIVKRFLIRRTKDRIKDQLPTKRDQVVFCLPTKLQRECYNNIVFSEDVDMLRRRDDQCDHLPPWVLAGMKHPVASAAALYFVRRRLEIILPMKEFSEFKHWATNCLRRPRRVLPRRQCCYKSSVYHFDKICADPECHVRLWLNEEDPALRNDLEASFYRGWWNENMPPKKDDGSHYVRGCKKCHCTNPELPTTPGCVPYSFLVLPTITQIVKAANHLGLLLDHKKNDSADFDLSANRAARNQRLDQIAFQGHEEYLNGDRMMLKLSNPEVCGKMKVLDELLKAWSRNGDKVLLFSQSVQLLDFIQTHIEAQGVGFVRIDGSTAVNKRQKLVNEFNTSPHIFYFLISTKAGGTGLNLQGANKVVIFEPNWNPAHDLQAQDRAFRLGQKRDVDVYRLILAGSIEEVIYRRQLVKEQKAAMAYGTENQRRLFSELADVGIATMFEPMEAPDHPKTQQLLQEADRREGQYMTNYVVPDISADGLGQASASLVDDDYGLAAVAELFPDSDVHEALAAAAYTHNHSAILKPSAAEDARVARAVAIHTPEESRQTFDSQRLARHGATNPSMLSLSSMSATPNPTMSSGPAMPSLSTPVGTNEAGPAASSAVGVVVERADLASIFDADTEESGGSDDDGQESLESVDLDLVPSPPRVIRAQQPPAARPPAAVRAMAKRSGQGLLEFAKSVIEMSDPDLERLIEQHYAAD